MDLKRLKWLVIGAVITLSSSLFAAAEATQKITHIEQLIIERDCKQLAVLYTQAVDFNQSEKVADLFTVDGRWSMGPQKVVGREAIDRLFKQSQKNKTHRTIHVLSNQHISIKSKTLAEGIAYVSLYHLDGQLGGEGMAHSGHPYGIAIYKDEYRLTASGWKIKQREIAIQFVDLTRIL
tara:strand:- start:33 stop:569 length:537 start_codon:yes stop_codon:yes gene_type:complete